ncbi:MAG: hypothetical protein GWM90_18890, partial [Gemmatimonadetes bacterium]|nr:Trm112 family protein [Gemmatimonadota bacterium]NIQ56452.1 Trm112 family protein [Gemmatimonadota bacterium]NIU76641.1 hypothetical protein [Gammaproteobacteria bacterium]NIX46081.1 hypothetical protein [Gemmatimonadota bacterium]NIY10404.1 hypothetical protein [Gemmatimonadota bacterium]
MDVSLSDLVTCPRCGPTYGLVLLPHDVAERRVSEGVLGCANCRERYPIAGGVADLRPGGGEAGQASVEPGVGDRESAIRLAALMGLSEVRGVVVVAGPAAIQARELAALLDGVEVVAIDGGDGGSAGVSPVRAQGVIPFRT